MAPGIRIHCSNGNCLLGLIALSVFAVLTGTVHDLGARFYLGGFALIPLLLSAVVIYSSLLQRTLPVAWGYWLAPVCVLMCGSYLSLIFRHWTGQPDALDSLLWFTLPIGHGLLLLVAVALHLISKPLINRYLSGQQQQKSNRRQIENLPRRVNNCVSNRLCRTITVG